MTATTTAQSRRAVQPRAKAARGLPSAKKMLLVGGAYLVALIFVSPYLEMLLTALRPVNEGSAATFLPKHYQWSNFSDVFHGDFTTNMKVTLEVAFGATALVLVVALPAAYYTARTKFRGRKVFLLLVLVTQMFQPTAMVVGI